jgi:hypothetical protein
MKRYNISATTGTFDAIAAGSAKTGTALFLGKSYKKVANLSALVTTLAETDTITLTARWQVSNDNATFVNVSHGSQNAAGVALGTGTAGADTAVTVAIPAPDAVYGWKFARLAIVVGVATGATVDTYSIGYVYDQLHAAEANR